MHPFLHHMRRSLGRQSPSVSIPTPCSDVGSGLLLSLSKVFRDATLDPPSQCSPSKAAIFTPTPAIESLELLLLLTLPLGNCLWAPSLGWYISHDVCHFLCWVILRVFILPLPQSGSSQGKDQCLKRLDNCPVFCKVSAGFGRKAGKHQMSDVSM